MENREIPNGWIETTLGEVIRTNISSIGRDYEYNEIIYLDTGSITENKIDGLQLLKLSDAPSRAKRLVKKNSIVYSTVRPIQRHYGILKNPPQNLVASTGFAVIECIEKKAYPYYIYYLISLNEIVQKLDMIANGSVSTYPSIKPSDIENLKVIIPLSNEEQKAIADVLSSLDEKIELLEEENKTLETLAQTIFTEWFVNFNFPGVTGEMEDSELGEIPKGWRVGKLGEIVLKLSKGTTPKQSGDESKIISFLKVKDITDSGNILLDTVEKIAEQVHTSSLSRSILEEKDILFSIAGTIGRVAIVPKHFHNSNCNQAIAFIRLDRL
jgi:type I restriction enzyme, S subunit